MADPRRKALAERVQRKLKRAGRASRSRQGLRQMQPSVRELDALWSRIIKARDGGACRRCGKREHLQAAHIRSRRYHSSRWSLLNGLALCAGCHLWSHGNPLLFGSFMAAYDTANYGTPAVMLLRASAPARIDRGLVLLELREAAKRYGVEA